MFRCSFLLRRIKCNAGILLCFIWVTISLLVMVSNAMLLMNYYYRSGKHRKTHRRTLYITNGLQPGLTIPQVNPTSITERLNFDIVELFRTKYDKSRPMSFEEVFNHVTTIPHYPYNQSGCRSIYSKRNKYHRTSLITQTRCPRDYTLLILVTSNISHFERRTLIRSTWGDVRHCDDHTWKVYFIVGASRDEDNIRKLSCESEMFQDIIFGDTIEDFFNLTYKVQMGFEWSLRYCNYRYLLKADDDVYVNLPTLFSFLFDKETPRTRLYAGNVNYVSPVTRSGKYAVSKKEYWKKVYPRYCSGGGFVLSRDVVRMMLIRFDFVVPLKIDDAYIGELALRSGVDTLHHDSFRMYEKEELCTYNSTFIVHHPVKNRLCMLKLFASHLFSFDVVNKFMK